MKQTIIDSKEFSELSFFKALHRNLFFMKSEIRLEDNPWEVFEYFEELASKQNSFFLEQGERQNDFEIID